VAEEPSRLLTVRWADLSRLQATHPAWQRYGERVLQQLLIRKAEREYELMCLDAAARYALFRTTHPGLEVRVAARHVASYLSITPVHLSRLRARARRLAAAS